MSVHDSAGIYTTLVFHFLTTHTMEFPSQTSSAGQIVRNSMDLKTIALIVVSALCIVLALSSFSGSKPAQPTFQSQVSDLGNQETALILQDQQLRDQKKQLETQGDEIFKQISTTEEKIREIQSQKMTLLQGSSLSASASSQQTLGMMNYTIPN